MKVKVYNLEGKEVREEELEQSFFDIVVKPEVVQQAVEAQLANSRQVLAHTKGRGEVRGGGKKPWKQKGTGRARHGSIRSPLWKGGGVTFGPTKERNFKKDINVKTKKKALRMVLADKVKHQKLILIDNFNLPAAKTQLLKQALDKLPAKGKSSLVTLDKKNANLVMAAKNLPKVSTLPAISLNVVDLLKHEYLLMPTTAVPVIVKHFS
ncbi:MAG TPA: 50S ribosomal protein L4 [Patescibacteria group bacterium]|nr:50S ribosomal protein L4 [Patescibacteria group bacterium]